MLPMCPVRCVTYVLRPLIIEFAALLAAVFPGVCPTRHHWSPFGQDFRPPPADDWALVTCRLRTLWIVSLKRIEAQQHYLSETVSFRAERRPRPFSNGTLLTCPLERLPGTDCEARMRFIEVLLGISPDNNSGTLETAILLIGFAIMTAPYFSYRLRLGRFTKTKTERTAQ